MTWKELFHQIDILFYSIYFIIPQIPYVYVSKFIPYFNINDDIEAGNWIEEGRAKYWVECQSGIFFNFIYLFFFNLSLHLLYSGLDISEIFAKKGGKNDFFFKKLLYKRRVENFKLLGFEPLFSDYFANHLKFHIISILLYLAKISTLT